MPSDFVEQLEKKWCPFHSNKTYDRGYCGCADIAAAIREALEEAEKIADNWPAECLTGHEEENCGPGIAEAIAALREGQNDA